MIGDKYYNMHAIPARIIRGGTSKAIVLERDDLPPPGAERDALVLQVFGSPDTRQIDGLGGADKLTSKLAVMGASTRADCDLDYLFGQVSIEHPAIDWSANCGNISSAAGLYAALTGAGKREGDTFRASLHQVNTGKRLGATIPMDGNAPAVTGDFAIGGVPGTSARIDLDFSDFAGSALGKGILPTGDSRDRFDVPGFGTIAASIVDMANLHFFVSAPELGIDLTRPVGDLQADSDLVNRLEGLRAVISREIGFMTGPDTVDRLAVSMNPLIYLVYQPTDYQAQGDRPVEAGQFDVLSRSFARYAFSKAYPASGGIGTAVAALLPGTLVSDVVPTLRGDSEQTVRIGHPGGLIAIDAQVASDAAGARVIKAEVARTARLLMDGRAYCK